MIFVAQPYYHTDPDKRKDRVELGAIYCGALLKQGKMCISPVMFGTPILEYVELPGDFSFWDKISFELLSKCTELHVLTMDGWDISRGVKAEMEKAKELNIPIIMVNSDDWGKEVEQSQIKII